MADFVNITDAVKAIKADFRDLGDTRRIEREVGLYVLTDVTRRAFDEGKAENGALYKGGKGYSKLWAEVRRAKGRQVRYIDLQFSRQLRQGYVLTLRTSTRIGYGWLAGYLQERAAKMERLFGPTFGFSSSNLEYLKQTFLKYVRASNRPGA